MQAAAVAATAAVVTAAAAVTIYSRRITMTIKPTTQATIAIMKTSTSIITRPRTTNDEHYKHNKLPTPRSNDRKHNHLSNNNAMSPSNNSVDPRFPGVHDRPLYQ